MVPPNYCTNINLWRETYELHQTIITILVENYTNGDTVTIYNDNTVRIGTVIYQCTNPYSTASPI